MASFKVKHGRREIFFSDHALDRWWERCRENEVTGRGQAMDLLRERMETAEWSRDLPSWARLSLWHQARAEGFVHIDDETGFVVNKNASRDLVAVTFLVRSMFQGRVA